MTLLVTKAAAPATLETPGAHGSTYYFRLPGGLRVRGGAGTGGSDSHYFLEDWRAIVPEDSFLAHDAEYRGLRIPAAWVEPAAAVIMTGVAPPVRALSGLDSHTARTLAEALAERFPGQTFALAMADAPAAAARHFLKDSVESVEIAAILETARNSGAVYVNREPGAGPVETVETVFPDSFPDGYADARAEARRLCGEYQMAEPGGGYRVTWVPDLETRRNMRESVERHKAGGYRDAETAAAERRALADRRRAGAAFGPERVAYLLRGEITLEETADLFSREYPGGPFVVGGAEYRLADDPDSPGFSWDYPTRAAAMADAGAAGLTVRDMTGEDS